MQEDERKIPPADLWDRKVAEGMSPDEATAYVAKIHGPPPTVRVERPAAPAARPDVTAALPRERPNASGDFGALVGGGIKGHARVIGDEVMPALAAHGLNAAPIPNAALALAGSLGSKATDSPMGYAEARAALDEMLGEIPPDMRAGEQLAGAPGAIPAVGQGVKALAKSGPYLRILARHVPGGRSVQGAVRDIRDLRKAAKATAKIAEPSAEAPAAAPTLEEALGLTPENMGLVAESAPLESRLIEAAKPWKPRSAPKARFDYMAERVAKRQAAPAVDVAKATPEPTLEELLALSNQHLKKGGTLEDLLRVNPGRPPR